MIGVRRTAHVRRDEPTRRRDPPDEKDPFEDLDRIGRRRGARAGRLLRGFVDVTHDRVDAGHHGVPHERGDHRWQRDGRRGVHFGNQRFRNER